MADQGVRRYSELQLIEKAWKEDAFREALRKDPRAAVERALGGKLPAGLQVKVVEETADTFYLVLPANPNRAPSGQLSDKELDAVAGGWSAASDCGSCANCGTNSDCATCAGGCK
jgi:hypothetical protein